MRWILIALLMITSATVSAQDYDYLIDATAARYGNDRLVFRAMVQKESRKQPWVFNVDGEGFWFQTKDQAVNALWALTSAPWLVKIIPDKNSKAIRRFFPSERAAMSFANSYQRSRQAQGFPLSFNEWMTRKKSSMGSCACAKSGYSIPISESRKSTTAFTARARPLSSSGSILLSIFTTQPAISRT
ncbi:hypothetical protein P4126_33235 [Pseudomonas aeruginosa]|nr:hypothetical protein [Pseudomonas aeruginosa]